MPNPSKPTTWLDTIPGWLKAAVGLVGTIAGFIITFRDNWRLYTTVAVVLALAYLFGVSLYILLKRRKARGKKNQWVFPYARFRPLGVLGMVISCLIFAGLVAIEPSRQFAMQGILGTFTPLPPPRLDSPDILIAPFDRDASAENRVERWLQDALETHLLEYGLNDVTVQLAEEPILSEQEALEAANARGSKAVIWGWHDPDGIQASILFSAGRQGDTTILRTGIIPLGSGEAPESSLSVVITKVLPQNVTFLSLFVIGHLEYLSNDYQAGYRAFDAATAAIPPEGQVTIKNQAILHFFQARRMEHDGGAPEDVICEYAKAIEADETFQAAYNNLAVVVSTLLAERTRISPEANECLERVLPYNDNDSYIWTGQLFERAALLNPDFTLARYNHYAFQWLQSGLHNPSIKAEMERIRADDPGIVGAYIILAIMEEQEDDPAGALELYESAVAVQPSLPLLHVNLGQLYLSHAKDESKAESAFLEALRLDPEHEEALLALGHLRYRQSQLSEAAALLSQILLAEERHFTRSLVERDALILGSTISYVEGETTPAVNELELALMKPYPDSLLHLLLGLLYQQEGQSERAAEGFRAAWESQDDPLYAHELWERFKELCFTGETSTGAFDEWALTQLPSSTCLPADPRERIRYVYDMFNDKLFGFRAAPQMIYQGAQCPFLYTEDPLTGEWQFETTILYQIVDREAAQIRPLQQFSGRLLVREEEPEISYLNRLYVIAEMADGSFRVLEPDIKELKHADGEYIVLHQGEEILVSLDDHPVTGDVSQWWVMAVGYYSPLR